MKKLLLTIGLLIAFAASPAGAVVWVSPSGDAPGPTGQGNIKGYGANFHGGLNIIGSSVTAAIGTPSAPTLSTNGTAGATSAVYACTAFDYNGAATIPSATATITTANATLSATNSVNVTCPGKVGALGFLIHKVDTSHIIGFCYSKSNTACTFVDTGTYSNGDASSTQTSSYTYTPNTADQTGATLGHFVSAQAALPTVGTGTVAAGGSDNAMEVSGGTSPVTVTFATAFTGKPVCVCGDTTSATGVCKAVPNANGATVVVTTAATDTFDLICVGK